MKPYPHIDIEPNTESQKNPEFGNNQSRDYETQECPQTERGDRVGSKPLPHAKSLPLQVSQVSCRRYFQIAVLITAREIDQQYEWTAHELAGRRQGLEQSVIDVVKYNKDVASLSAKDATLITFGRALFREHRVSSELWESMVNQFGRQRTVQLMMIMGEYFKAGFMMNAVDQHLPPGREALLPPLKR